MKSNKKNKEYNFFNKLSEEWWDEKGKFGILHKIRPLRIEYILQQMNNKKVKNLKILDIGCGGGLVSESLSKLGAVVTGIDFAENNIRVAKQHSAKSGLKIEYKIGDIEKIKLKKNFDVIIAFEVLEHLNDWKKFLNRIKNNLNKNGIFIISTINRNLLSKYTAIFIAENLLRWIPKGTHNYNKFIKPNEIIDNFKNTDLLFNDLTGLVYDPTELRWRLSKNTMINYFCSFKKT